MTAVVNFIRATPAWLLEHPATLAGAAAVVTALVVGAVLAWTWGRGRAL